MTERTHILSEDSTLLSKQIMNKLIDLKEWQQRQEQLLRQSQEKQLLIINEQKEKLNILTQNQLDLDLKCGINTNEANDGLILNVNQNNHNCHQDLDSIEECIETNNSDIESVEQIRAEPELSDAMDGKPLDAFNDQSMSGSYLESSPVKPGIDGKHVKTFEELLNIRLSNEKNTLKDNSDKPLMSDKIKTKKPFLRKGEGIKRFEGNRSQTKKNSLNERQTKVNSHRSESYTKANEKCLPKMNSKTPLNSFKNRNLENKLNAKVNEQKNLKPEQKSRQPLSRKVIPLTTKLGANKPKSKEVIISRNTPTYDNKITENESALFDYLEYICGNISLNDSKTDVRDRDRIDLCDSNYSDKDINELQTLLQKIQIKKNAIQQKLEDNNGWVDDSDEEIKSKTPIKSVKKCSKTKKKVSWSPNTIKSNEADDKENIDLNEPKLGAYSSSLKQQILELENRMSSLKSQSVEKESFANTSVRKTSNSLSPMNEEVVKLKDQIELFNKRLISIESKSYDIISRQREDLANCKLNTKPKQSYSVERNSNNLKTRANGLNLSVKQNESDTTVDFANGDQMKIANDNTVFYTFSNGATQTIFPDGLKIINFPNGQIEKLYKNGVKHITYNNGLQRIINPDSSEEVIQKDGTIWRIHSDGTESLQFPNGDREIRTDKYKRREYSNGNIKTLYSDGTEETRFVSGRLRIKDKLGNVIVDSFMKHLNQH